MRPVPHIFKMSSVKLPEVVFFELTKTTEFVSPSFDFLVDLRPTLGIQFNWLPASEFF